MISLLHPEPDDSEFVEVDPTGRYVRYNEILGKGASKTVYRAFDEYDGIEVAWNQVKLYDFLRSPEDLERLYCEIHLLRTLKHPNIMKFYTSWVDTANRNINFVTEMFTSGTLRQYRLKHKRVNIKAVKNWCRQILRGLLYLHSHNPPVIHRDLKCDNIFINGNQGEVKIGDLGLAAILKNSHAAHCVGTPEFMAPEVYEEDYDELVDIYSFGMCILEMATFEYPYSECTHPAEIYKKVISGKMPDALYKVKDPELLKFVGKCLATVSQRLSAWELLNDSFLQIDDHEADLGPVVCDGELACVDSLLRQPFFKLDCEGSSYNSSNLNGYSNGFVSEVQNGYSNGFISEVQRGYSLGFEAEVQNGWEYPQTDIESGIELFDCNDVDFGGSYEQLDVSIKGKRKEEGNIFLRIRVLGNEGRVRNIYFPFDIESDTALIVATEMVGELDITDQDVTKIADMIDGEIASLVPDWKPGLGIKKTPCISNVNFCNNYAVKHTSNGSLVNFLSNHSGTRDLKTSHCLGNECASMHGRFEEITYQVDSPMLHVLSGANNPTLSCQSNGFHVAENQDQRESLECSSLGSGENHSIEEHEIVNIAVSAHDEKEIGISNKQQARTLHKFLSAPIDLEEILPMSHDFPDEYDHEMQQELRWIRTKYQMDMMELGNQQLAHIPKPSKVTSGSGTGKQKTKNGILSSLATKLKRKTYQQAFPKSSDKNVKICMNALSLRTASVRYPKLP